MSKSIQCALLSLSAATAVHVLLIAPPAVDFFNQINMLYGTLFELCTSETCPTMSAGPKYERVAS